jgi:hypothetical protein
MPRDLYKKKEIPRISFKTLVAPLHKKMPQGVRMSDVK